VKQPYPHQVRPMSRSTPKARKTRVSVQLDFWPELSHRSMVFYAACAGRRAPARSVSEDGRAVSGLAATSGLPDGNHGDNLTKVRQ
jgi:hypothetical protein